MPCPWGPRGLSVDARTPFVVDCPGKDGGRTAHNMLRSDAVSEVSDGHP